MAAGRDLVRTSDVTVWGVVALATWAVAVLGANLSALMPQGVLAGLHASRLDGGTLNQLRGAVAGLESEAAQLRRENAALVQRFELAERQAGAVTRRVGALEVSVPRLIEALPRDAEIDRAAVTASTGESRTFAVDGGEVTVRQRPLAPSADALAMPPPLTFPQAARATGTTDAERVAEVAPLGIALGSPVAPSVADAVWRGIEEKVGAVLLGLDPILAPASQGRRQIVVGPMASLIVAEAMCAHMEAIAITCAVATYDGEAME